MAKSASYNKDTFNVVTRSNFEAVLPHVIKLLEKASFVTIDTELSGLCTFRSSRYSIFDDLQQRYSKLADSASSFALLQFGLGIFVYDGEKEKCTCSVFSFHLFPAASPGQPERKFAMQISSIAFLAEHEFNFNATFNQGIPYLSRADEQQQLGRVDNADKEKPAVIDLKKSEDVEFVKSVIEHVDKWVADGSKGKLFLPPCNGYQRLLTYQQIEAKYGEAFYMVKERNPDGAFCVSVTAVSAEEKSTLQAAEANKAVDKIKADVGFRVVIDKISELKLPIIGHNCFLDICHVYEKFIGRMPADLTDFKSKISDSFPLIFDTKFLASKDPELALNGSYSLSDLFKYFEGCREDLLYAPGLQKNLNEHFHDAGFDAYCTGLAFIGLAHKASQGQSLDPLKVFEDSDHRNKLYVMQSPYLAGINLQGPDTEPDRSHIFLLTGFPDTFKSSQLYDALSKVTQSDQFSVQMSHGQTNEAYVSFKSDYQFTDNPVIAQMIKKGQVIIEGQACRWLSFEASRMPPVVLGKRESDESI